MNYEQARTLKSVSARSTDHERLIGKILERLDQMHGDMNVLGERISDSDLYPTTLQERVFDLERKADQMQAKIDALVERIDDDDLVAKAEEPRRVRLPRKKNA